MHFITAEETDIGISKKTNQDSLLIKHASCRLGEVLMAIVCDGMGGLSKGEVASSTVIRRFAIWFEEELPFELEKLDLNIIGEKWTLMLKELNSKMMEYSQTREISLGTTFSGILFVGQQYMFAHVGDSRIYYLSSEMKQLTRDQTFIAREISRGTMTVEQARTDKRRNMLLQCIGASESVEPDVEIGECKKGVYLLCSDGFRHEISEQEIYDNLNATVLKNEVIMHEKARQMIETIKTRKEKDNISVILVKAEQ